MDNLALLCNLHGDGPATLAGLRELGIHELPDLARLDPEQVIRLLGGSESSAVRFLREGRILQARLEGEPGGEPVVVQPTVAAEPAASVPPDPEPPAKVIDLVPRPAATHAPASQLNHTPPVAAPADHDPVVHAVLGLWNHLERDPGTPLQAGCALEESGLEGLRGEEIVLLAQAGVHTLEDLASADPLAVSEQAGVAYTHLSHLCFLARKRMRGNTASPARGVKAGEDPGGPFA